MKNSHLTGKERLQKLSQRLTEGEVFNPVDEGVDRLLFSKLRQSDCLGNHRLVSNIWFDVAYNANLREIAKLSISMVARMSGKWFFRGITVKKLAENNHTSDHEVLRCLGKLEELKFIKIIEKGKGGRANQYAILWHPLFSEYKERGDDYDDSSL